MMRFLADVRGNEGPTALLIAAYLCLTSLAFKLLAPPLAAAGFWVPLWATALTGLLVVALVVAYAMKAHAVARLPLTVWMTIVTAVGVAASAIGASEIEPNHPLYLILTPARAVISVHAIVIALDAGPPKTALRLLPLALAGLLVGNFVGRAVAPALYHGLHIQLTMVVGAATLLLSLVPIILLARRPVLSSAAEEEAAAPTPSSSGYIALITLVVVLTYFTDEVGPNASDVLLSKESGARAVWAHRNVVQLVGGGIAIAVQLFVVSRLLKTIGVAATIAIAPVMFIALNALSGSGLLPVTITSWGRVIELGLGQTVYWTSVIALFLPLHRSARIAAVALILAIGGRLGVASGGLFVGTIEFGVLSARQVLLGNALVSAALLALAVVAARMFQRRMQSVS